MFGFVADACLDIVTARLMTDYQLEIDDICR
jgi:hypothetical protein